MQSYDHQIWHVGAPKGVDSNEIFVTSRSRDKLKTSEYNLEFQGSVRNPQKNALFMKFYPEMPWYNTEMR